MGELKPITLKDCMEYPALPDLQVLRRDLYYCARSRCRDCSRKTIKGKKADVFGCRIELLDDANEFLARIENTRVFIPEGYTSAKIGDKNHE